MAKKDTKISAGLSALLGERDEAMSVRSGDGGSRKDGQADRGGDGEDPGEPHRVDVIDTIDDEDLKRALIKKRMEKRGRPPKSDEEREKWDEQFTRYTTIMRRDHIEKLKAICLRETMTMKEALGQIIGDAIERYEERNGKIKPMSRKGGSGSIFK